MRWELANQAGISGSSSVLRCAKISIDLTSASQPRIFDA
jgi:hypothetical protein